MSTPGQMLRPGDLLVVRLGGLGSELIRIGEEMTHMPGDQNHVAVMHHWDDQIPWGLEGRPGGVGWADLRPYIASPYTINNIGQPGRGDGERAKLCTEAQAMLGTAYDWAAIADDTLRAFGMGGLFARTFSATRAAGHVVCSSYAAFLYERQGWQHPAAADRDTEPGDWAEFIMVNRYNVALS